jgi:hypothetical protein
MPEQSALVFEWRELCSGRELSYGHIPFAGAGFRDDSRIDCDVNKSFELSPWIPEIHDASTGVCNGTGIRWCVNPERSAGSSPFAITVMVSDIPFWIQWSACTAPTRRELHYGGEYAFCFFQNTLPSQRTHSSDEIIR